MKQFRNRKATSEIGIKIRNLRHKAGYSLDDVAYMTGFTQSLLSSIENGGETGLSHLIEIAKAINIHPKELLDIPIDIKPRYALSPQRKLRNRLTASLNLLVDDSNFFTKPKFVREVIDQLSADSKNKPASASVSVILNRLVDAGKLKFSLSGRQKLYYKKKKN